MTETVVRSGGGWFGGRLFLELGRCVGRTGAVRCSTLPNIMTGVLCPEICKKVVFCLCASQFFANFWNVWHQSRRHDFPWVWAEI